jgi:HSP20 family molecular chaperone IbpA
LLEADLPGVTDETLQVEVTDLVLTLHARLDWAVPEGARVLYTESPGGDYHRAFILSDEVDRSQITAQLANGVLRLWLPRGDGRKSRRVEVKSV